LEIGFRFKDIGKRKRSCDPVGGEKFFAVNVKEVTTVKEFRPGV